MPTLTELRERELRKISKAEKLVEEATQSLRSAEQMLSTRKGELDIVKPQVAERLRALEILDGMLAEAKAEAEIGPYRDLAQEDAMREVLRKADSEMNSADLAEAMTAGGYVFTSSNPPNSVVVAANKNSKGYFFILKEGNRSLIGLQEWKDRDEEGEEADS